jgi:hypothetical protein
VSDDNEYPSFWAAGFHHLTLAEVREKCVAGVKLSSTRSALCEALEHVHETLVAAGLQGQIWVDGSFVTEKIDPTDVDFVLLLAADDYDAATPEAQTLIDGLVEPSGGWPPSGCDTNFALIYPPSRSNSPDVLTYWKKRFGYSQHTQTPKGIVVITVGKQEVPE